MEPLKIAFVTSEVHPFSKTGGLADVSAALPAFLARAGHDVRVVTPLYAKVDRAKYPLQAPPPELRNVPVRFERPDVRVLAPDVDPAGHRPADPLHRLPRALRPRGVLHERRR
jgi:hypothetical protein